MKVLLEYDESTNQIIDANGLYIGTTASIKGFEQKKESLILDLIKQGITPDEIIKLKNNELL